GERVLEPLSDRSRRSARELLLRASFVVAEIEQPVERTRRFAFLWFRRRPGLDASALPLARAALEGLLRASARALAVDSAPRGRVDVDLLEDRLPLLTGLRRGTSQERERRNPGVVPDRARLLDVVAGV